MDYTSILFNESPLVVSPQLAKIIGLNEAIVLQQLHYWLQKAPKIRDDRAWIYNSIRDWQEQFPFFGINTIRRTLEKLVADGVVIKGDYNKTSFDKTSWWTIDYEALDTIVKNRNSICPKWANGYAQNGQIDLPNVGEPIPETNTDTNSENNKKEKEKKKSGFNDLIEAYTENPDLKEALCAFIKMRAANKKPMTDRALKMLLEKLKRMTDADEVKIALLDQSIYHGWQDIYPLKEQKDNAENGIDYHAEAAKWKS